MVDARKLASILVGMTQCILGGIASFFIYLIYQNPEIRMVLSLAEEEKGLAMFLLLVFVMFAFMSGLLLVQDANGG